MSKLIDLTGQKFGHLTVLERVIDPNCKATKWLCKCDCGKEKIVYGSNLTAGKTKSCGCYRKEKLKELKLEDLTGRKFGRLTVIKLHHYDESSRQYYWLCECECGSTSIVYSGHLKDGHTQSCGCLVSIGEEKIANILKENNFSFIKSYTSHLVLPTGGRAKYDFAVYNNDVLSYLIEYDGWQHKVSYESSNWDRNGRFEIRQQSDLLKNEYCLNNNIPLIRIPHTRYKELNINDLKLETTTFLIERK